MNLFGGAISVTGITFLVCMGFEIIFFGYLLGRIRIKGVSLGAAGVFIIALLFGVLYSTEIGQTVTQTVAGEKSSSAMETRSPRTSRTVKAFSVDLYHQLFFRQGVPEHHSQLRARADSAGFG